jgi:hypothetical protein
MKKLTAMLLTLCFAMMVVGCGDEGGKAKPKTGGDTPAKAPEKKAP